MNVIFTCPSVLIEAMVSVLLPNLTLNSELIIRDCNECKQLEVSNICHLTPFLSFRHFYKYFQQQLCVSHFSGFWMRQLNNASFLSSWNVHSDEHQISQNFRVQNCLDKRKSGKEQAKGREQNEEKSIAIVKFRTGPLNTTIVYCLCS